MQDLAKPVVLFGYSGHAFVVAEAAILCGMKLKGYADAQATTRNPFELDYLGDEKDPAFLYWNSEYNFLVGIGDNKLRGKIAQTIRNKGQKCVTLLHPHSSVSAYVEIGEGTFIGRNSAINPFCVIGKDVIVNTSASLDHECVIGDGSHIAPGAVLAGNVTIGTNSFVGANAVIKQGVVIGDNVLIGAGSVVIRDIESNQIFVGNPARNIID